MATTELAKILQEIEREFRGAEIEKRARNLRQEIAGRFSAEFLATRGEDIFVVSREGIHQAGHMLADDLVKASSVASAERLRAQLPAKRATQETPQAPAAAQLPAQACAMPAAVPAGEQAESRGRAAEPILLTWREIIEALGRSYSKEFVRQLRRLNDKRQGPIIPGAKGEQPRADRNKLVEWFNLLADSHAVNEDTQTARLEQDVGEDGQRVFIGKSIAGTVKANQRSVGHLQRKDNQT